jgi:RNA polymerase sigma factor (sigma-70 family)
VTSSASKALRQLTSHGSVSILPPEPDKEASARAWLADAITHLPTRERLALALCYQEGLSCDEMAIVLGMPVEEAEQLHTRALSNLAARIAANE